jgi:hypothetical protein
MADTHLLLSLSQNRQTQETGWHSRGGPYDDQYVELIQDPTDATPRRMLTAIPSPFARLHLFDAAFQFVCKRVNNKADHSGASVFHQAVSECLDVLELLFGWSSHSNSLKLVKWNANQNLAKLVESTVEGQRLLAEVLNLFLSEDGKSANFEEQPTFYVLMVDGEVLALSSPLTLFISSPNAAQQRRVINPDTKSLYFTDIRQLHKRAPDFQKYLHWLFYNNSALRKKCLHMYGYLTQSLELLQDENYKLASEIKAFEDGEAVAQLDGSLVPLRDNEKESVTILGAELYERGYSKIVADIAKRSKLLIRTKRALNNTVFDPLILQSNHDSFGTFDGKTGIPDVSGTPIDQRILPDSGVKYPFLVVEDMIEDRLIRLPFKMNSERFCSPQCQGFAADDDWSFLPPLKMKYFDYFDPIDISTNARFISKGAKDSVVFELDIPVRGGKVTFRKAFNESKQLPKNGLIVNARMSCAVFPFVTVSGQEQFSDRYWVMLVDQEGEQQYKNTDCFDLHFYSVTKEGESIPIPMSKDINAEKKVCKTKRTGKEVLLAGSTYFEISGGRFDYMQLEAFASDADRKTHALIVPKWKERALGNQGAVVAIDFGTTNTHVSWILEGSQDKPQVLTVESRDLQMAVLSAPQKASSDSAQFDKFPSSLAQFEGRLHHEFVPSIVSEKSPYKFPLRTATSEQTSLHPGAYQTLANVNIAFMFGIERHLDDERITSDLKWSVRSSDSVQKRVESFIRELLIIIRTKMILNDVDPRLCRIVWFKPLSFDESTKGYFEDLWTSKVAEVFHAPTPNPKLLCLTESEAPYYYHEKAATITTSKPVLCVDIGGGSTDVVIFDQDGKGFGAKVPKIGTSFSFAGNALWGSGYDAVRHEQTGIVRKYGSWVEEQIRHLPDVDTGRRIGGVYKEIVDSGAASEEYLNFFFSIDDEVEFSKKLARDSWVKCLVLIHYAAIIFHCAQVMRSCQMEAPEFICLSGRGARSIEILDSSPRKSQVALLTHALFEAVYGVPIPKQVDLRIAVDSKEATCNGGVLKVELTAVEPTSVVAIGDGCESKEQSLQPTYEELLVDGKSLDGVVANIAAFADCIVRLNRTLSFRAKFGIDVDVDNVCSVLKDNVKEYINLGLSRHGYIEKPKERINETLFFYPLIQKLFEIGRNVAES